MVGTTVPVVYGRRRWKLIIAIYSLSQVAGALATGLLAWSVGTGLRAVLGLDFTVTTAVIAAVAAFGALHDLQLTTVWLPASRWQVPWQWKRFPRPLMAAMFGFAIGMGVLTRIPFAAFHVVLIATMLVCDLQSALLVMLVYGATRALGVGVASQLQMLISDVRQRPRAINRMGPLVGYLNGIILAAVAGTMVGSLSRASF